MENFRCQHVNCYFLHVCRLYSSLDCPVGGRLEDALLRHQRATGFSHFNSLGRSRICQVLQWLNLHQLILIDSSFCPRWLVSQGQFDKSIGILKKFARINRRTVDDKTYDRFKVNQFYATPALLLIWLSPIGHLCEDSARRRMRQKLHSSWSIQDSPFEKNHHHPDPALDGHFPGLWRPRPKRRHAGSGYFPHLYYCQRHWVSSRHFPNLCLGCMGAAMVGVRFHGGQRDFQPFGHRRAFR